MGVRCDIKEIILGRSFCTVVQNVNWEAGVQQTESMRNLADAEVVRPFIPVPPMAISEFYRKAIFDGLGTELFYEEGCASSVTLFPQ